MATDTKPPASGTSDRSRVSPSGVPRNIPAGAPVVPDVVLNPSNQRLLTIEEQTAIAEPHEQGDLLYIKISEDGEPTGEGLLDAPTDGTPVARAMVVTPTEAPVVTTPTGAPLTNQMNPVTDLYDPALLERNPIPFLPIIEPKDDPNSAEALEARRKARNDARKAADEKTKAAFAEAQRLREEKRKEIDDKYEQRMAEQEKRRAENRLEPNAKPSVPPPAPKPPSPPNTPKV